MKIKEMPVENRPRERLQKLGEQALSDAELLAIILQKGTKQDNVIDLSNKLLAKFKLGELSKLSLTELQVINGIGPAKAMQIKALFELNKRIKVNDNSLVFSSAKIVFDFLSPKLSGLDKEHFIVLLLDSKNKLIKEELISIGTLNASLIHPREIFKPAIKESANSIILVHNHPSGDCTPSKNDEKITELLKQTSTTINIPIIDHIIISKNSYYSFQEKKLFLD